MLAHRRAAAMVLLQGCRRWPEPVQVLAHGGGALRADTATLPVRRARQPGTHLQSGRRRRSLSALCRGSSHSAASACRV